MKNTDNKPFDNAALSLIEREVSNRVDAQPLIKRATKITIIVVFWTFAMVLRFR